MFTWICPKCGNEVPPAYSQCPRCTGQQQAASPQPPQQQQPQPPPPQAPPPPPVQAYAPPPPQYQPPQPQYAPAPPAYVLPEPKRGMPGWAVMLLVAAVLGGGLLALYKYTSGNAASDTPKAALERPAAASGDHPYAKFIEVTGLRLTEDSKQKVKLRYLVVNHSRAEMPGLALQLTLAAKGESASPIAVVKADVGNLPPDGSKEMESPVNTKLRAYELPDWQFLRATFVVTAPQP